jgi:hypothetical protein
MIYDRDGYTSSMKSKPVQHAALRYLYYTCAGITRGQYAILSTVPVVESRPRRDELL